MSERIESIGWQVRRGVRLSRITVTVNGRPYRTLGGGGRSMKVSFVGLPRETVFVRVTGVGVSGRRYVRTFTFHTCVPRTAGSGGWGVPYLRAG